MMIDTIGLMVKIKHSSSRRMMSPWMYAREDLQERLRIGKKMVSTRSRHHPMQKAWIKEVNGWVCISGSVLKWMFGHNIAYDGNWVSLVKAWASDVIGICFPGCYIVASRITKIDIFAMVLCGTYGDIEHAIDHYGNCLYSKQRRSYLRKGKSGNTAYIGNANKSRHSVLRVYDKATEILDRSPVRGKRYLVRSPTLLKAVRVEVSLCYRKTNNRSFGSGRWERLDLAAIYMDYLAGIYESSPYIGRPRLTLTPDEFSTLRRWQNALYSPRGKHSSNDRNLRCSIRKKRGYDLKRSYLDYHCLDQRGRHIRLADLSDLRRDCNGQIWRELQQTL